MPTTTAEQAARNLRAALDAGRKAAERSLFTVGAGIVGDIHATLGSPVYPSLPGAPPARRTGRLQASYRYIVRRDELGRTYLAVFSGAPAASFLEFGTSTVAPRPALRPATEQARPIIPGAVARAWEAGVHGAAKGR